MKGTSTDRDELLITVARLYYEFDQSQQQIADRLEISRSSVSRLLSEAKDRGIVSIQIRESLFRDFALEQEVIDAFGLRDAYVLETSSHLDETALLKPLGNLAVTYLQRVIASLGSNSSIGVAWGTSVEAAVQSIPDKFGQQIDVVQLLGGVGTLVVDSPDLARMVAVKLGGRHYDLPAPVLVAQPALREALLTEPAVRDGIARAQSVELAITGVGTTQHNSSSFLRAGLITEGELAQLRESGAVGEMCGRFFNSDGESQTFAINQRVVGIELEDLQHIPRVLAVARGIAKVPSILGALRGRFMSVLVTDDITARALLSLV